MPVVAEAISDLKAPFPWFGGKRRVANIVWPRFGNVPNYVEPFAGSLAVLLARPEIWPAKNETVNDIDCYLANFWRSTLHAPGEVAHWADWPVNEADLHARHQWLHDQVDFREAMRSDPGYYDAKVAGWWVWGLSCWIGDNWCNPNPNASLPDLKCNRGINASKLRRPSRQSPMLKGQMGVHSHRLPLKGKMPLPKAGGVGVHRSMPDISGHNGASGRGVHAKYCSAIEAYFERLSHRLRRVRVCCGDWKRVLGPSPTIYIGVTGVLLDPPYGAADRDEVYNHDDRDVAAAVRSWCVDHEDEPKLRIALCGYAGEHDELEARGWDVIAWKAAGGYGARNPANDNGSRERIWFSPHCLKPAEGQATMFEEE